jgi:hypothetical protein
MICLIRATDRMRIKHVIHNACRYAARGTNPGADADP